MIFFQSQISYVDPEFLDIFTFPAILGDTKSIKNQADVIVSQTMAKRLFGENYPIGKSIIIINDAGKEYTYTISAVFKDLPENSSFRIDVISHYDNFLLMYNRKDSDWKEWATVLFITVPDKSMVTCNITVT